MIAPKPPLSIIAASAAAVLALAASLFFAGPPARAWNSTDMAGTLPPLDFTMARASDGKQVTGADYKGKIALLFFGYTSCPDECPTTMLNLTTALKTMGPSADNVRVLFATVDPNRDTLEVLKKYAGNFAPQTDGLRGTPDQLATLAKRYRVAYSLGTPDKNGNYEVTHSNAVYVFDRKGDIRLLMTGLTEPNTNLDGATADLRQLIAESDHPNLWQRILSLL